MASSAPKVIHRRRMNHAHYAGGLVDGAEVLKLFGDVATELMVHQDGQEGLFRAYQRVEFLAPVYVGDFLEIHGEITRVGNRSRQMAFKAWKVIEASRDPKYPEKAGVLKKPLLVCEAEGTCVATP